MTVCPAPNCVYEHKENLLKHMLVCRNISKLQCEVCEVECKDACAKCRHRKKNKCVATDTPQRSWWDTPEGLAAIESERAKVTEANADDEAQKVETLEPIGCTKPVHPIGTAFEADMLDDELLAVEPVIASPVLSGQESKSKDEASIVQATNDESNVGPCATPAVTDESSVAAVGNPMLIPDVFPTKYPLPAQDVVSPLLQALRGDDGKMITEMRTSDGMVNATKMCKSAFVLFKDFTKKAETKKFFEELAKHLGIAPQKDNEDSQKDFKIRSTSMDANDSLQRRSVRLQARFQQRRSSYRAKKQNNRKSLHSN